MTVTTMATVANTTELDERQAKLLRNAAAVMKWAQVMLYELEKRKVMSLNGPADRDMAKLRASLDAYSEKLKGVNISEGTW